MVSENNPKDTKSNTKLTPVQIRLTQNQWALLIEIGKADKKSGHWVNDNPSAGKTRTLQSLINHVLVTHTKGNRYAITRFGFSFMVKSGYAWVFGDDDRPSAEKTQEQPDPAPHADLVRAIKEFCWDCAGTGTFVDVDGYTKTCPECEGLGSVILENEVQLDAPKFAVGQRVHIPASLLGWQGEIMHVVISGITERGYEVEFDNGNKVEVTDLTLLRPCDCPPEKPKSIPAMMPVAAVMPIHTTFKPIFQLGDVVRTPRGYTSKVVGYGKRASYELENGNFYGADELTLDIHGAVCDVCGDWQPDVITDDGIEICNDCRKRSRRNNRQHSTIGELNRPPQVPAEYRIEVVMTPRQAQLVSVAVEVHAVPQIAGLLPAPKASDPVADQPAPKFPVGAYVVIDPTHPKWYGREGVVIDVAFVQGGFVYALQTPNGAMYRNIREGFLHAATPEKPAAYVAFKAAQANQLYLGKLIFIRADGGYLIYGSYAGDVESALQHKIKGVWTPAGVYELFIPMNQMGAVQKQLVKAGKFFVRLNTDGSIPPIFARADTGVRV